MRPGNRAVARPLPSSGSRSGTPSTANASAATSARTVVLTKPIREMP